MQKQPRVTVILTSYNHAKYLRASIDSVLAQTYPDFGLIIWDDASIDDSWQIIQSYSDPRIRAFRNETNLHGGSVRRALAQGVQSEYIAIQHSDDIWEPEKLEKQVAYLDANPQTGAVFTQVSVIDEEGAPFKDPEHFYYAIFEQPNRSRYEWLNHFFYHGNALCHPSALVRRACYEECGPVRYGMAQIPDMDTWVRICLKYEIHILPEKLTRFRVRDGGLNISAGGQALRVRMYFELLQVLQNFRNIHQPDEFLKIFPTAGRFMTTSGMDVDYALGMMALEAGRGQVGELFGLTVLFDALNDPIAGPRMQALYGFGQKEFVALTAAKDVFLAEKLPILQDQIHNQNAQIQELESVRQQQLRELESARQQLSKIYRSKGWRMMQGLNRLLGSLRPAKRTPPY